MKAKVLDLLKSLHLEDTFFSVVEYLEHNLSQYRFEHTLRVAWFAYQLAHKEKQNTVLIKQNAVMAALLHDITKEQKTAFHYSILEKVKNQKKDIYKIPKAVLHSQTAALFAEEKFGIDTKMYRSAIEFHTIGHTDMGSLDFIVFAADYLGSFDLPEAQEKFSLSIQELCLEKVSRTLDHLISRRRQIMKETIDFYNFLIVKMENAGI